MGDKVLEALENVTDAQTFFAFLNALQHDVPTSDEVTKHAKAHPYSSGVRGWENGSIATFLDAAIAGGQDNQIGHHAKNAQQAWRAAAEIIYCGKSYE